MTQHYNKAQFIEFLADDMTGPGFGGEIEISQINDQFSDVSLIPSQYVWSVMERLYGPKSVEKEFRFMQTKVTGYTAIKPK